VCSDTITVTTTLFYVMKWTCYIEIYDRFHLYNPSALIMGHGQIDLVSHHAFFLCDIRSSYGEYNGM
jgi:hypothetical protein